MLATTKTPLLLTGAAAAVLAIGVTVGLNSPSGTVRAEGPARFGTLVDTTVDAETSPNIGGLAQATAGAVDVAAEPTPADLQLTIQKLRDEIEQLKQDREALSAQSQSDRVAADAAREELNAAIELQRRKNDDLLRQFQNVGTDEAAAASASTETTAAAEPSWNFQSRDPQTDRIIAALDAETEVEFIDVPLNDAFQFFSELHGVPIVFDEISASDLGITADQGISLELSGVSLKSALEIMLKKLDLDYVVENQVLNITTREYADSVMETRVYSLKPLPAEYNPEDLARVVIRTIAPDSWRNSVIPAGGSGSPSLGGMMGSDVAYEYMDATGMESLAPSGGSGIGSIEPLPGVLVVTQSQRVHRQIVDLLSQLKRQHDQAGSSGGNDAMGMGGMSGFGNNLNRGLGQRFPGSGGGRLGDTRRAE